MSARVSKRNSAPHGGFVALGVASCMGGYIAGTASSYALPTAVARTSPNPDTPSITPNILLAASVADDMLRAKRVSGLTWDELSRVLGVTRRTVHNWANGRPISLSREGEVKKLMAFLREIDTGEAGRNRALLLADVGRGQLVIDLLRAQQWDSALRSANVARIQGSLNLDQNEVRATDLFDAILDRPPAIEGALSKKGLLRRSVKTGGGE